MAKKINPLVLSYPNFVLGQIIDPEEANQNNADIADKVNEFIDDVEEALEIAEDVDAKVDAALDTAGVAEGKADDAIEIAEAAESKADNAVSIAGAADTKANNAVSIANTALGQDDVEPYSGAKGAVKIAQDTQEVLNAALVTLNEAIETAQRIVLEAESSVGNTEIKYDVYTIVISNNGDGTFTYSDGIDDYIGVITPEGYQRFELKDMYFVGLNRIEATINDALTRSMASGGLQEVGEELEASNLVDLTYPMGSDTEVTFRYYKQISLGGRHAPSHSIFGTDPFILLNENDTPYAGQIVFKEV